MIDALNSQPEAEGVIVLGDLTFSDGNETLEQYTEYMRFFSDSLSWPLYSVVGNHDNDSINVAVGAAHGVADSTAYFWDLGPVLMIGGYINVTLPIAEAILELRRDT